MYNRAKELYCDTTIFVFWFFIVYLPKTMEAEKWPEAADSPLLTVIHIICDEKYYSCPIYFNFWMYILYFVLILIGQAPE